MTDPGNRQIILDGFNSDIAKFGSDVHFLSPDSPEKALEGAYADVLRERLGDYLCDPGFEAAAVPDILRDAMEGARDSVVRRALVQEGFQYYEENRVLTTALGGIAVGGIQNLADVARDRDVVVPSEEFHTGLKESIDEFDFTNLEQWKKQLPPAYISLIHDINELSKSGDDDWANQAFDLILSAKDRLDQYQITTEKVEALIAVCFLPMEARQLTRRLLLGGAITNQMKEQLGVEITPADQRFLGLIQKFYGLKAVVGAFGKDYRERLSIDRSDKISALSIEALEVLTELQTMMDRGEGLPAADTYDGASKFLLGSMRQVSKDNRTLEYWESQDIGHVFSDFTYFDLGGLLILRGHSHEFVNPEKDGSMAVILEDDQEQAGRYERLIDKYTASKTDPEHIYVDPGDLVERFAEDPKVGLFLIDIQGVDGAPVGVDVGRRILEGRIDYIRGLTPEDREALGSTTIVVWSNSPKHVERASAEFRDLIQSFSPEIHDQLTYSLSGGGQSRPHSLITFRVRAKGWNFSDTPYRR